ncbi:MAG TPA: hypothetical protein VM682_03395 [Bacillus sp. (in: firmicutes)]|nr:hypothetical protein [Bacillus sp. (in: firmicutes)]
MSQTNSSAPSTASSTSIQQETSKQIPPPVAENPTELTENLQRRTENLNGM